MTHHRLAVRGGSLALVAAVLLGLALALPVLAAEPDATPGTGGDPRSPGQGPGLVGDPLFALGVVVIVALVSVVLTLAYVRATAPGRARDGG